MKIVLLICVYLWWMTFSRASAHELFICDLDRRWTRIYADKIIFLSFFRSALIRVYLWIVTLLRACVFELFLSDSYRRYTRIHAEETKSVQTVFVLV